MIRALCACVACCLVPPGSTCLQEKGEATREARGAQQVACVSTWPVTWLGEARGHQNWNHAAWFHLTRCLRTLRARLLRSCGRARRARRALVRATAWSNRLVWAPVLNHTPVGIKIKNRSFPYFKDRTRRIFWRWFWITPHDVGWKCNPAELWAKNCFFEVTRRDQSDQCAANWCTNFNCSFYHARMARRAQHLWCSLCERSERADDKLDKGIDNIFNQSFLMRESSDWKCYPCPYHIMSRSHREAGRRGASNMSVWISSRART